MIPTATRTYSLVIGYGNDLRSDDAAGRRAAERVESLGLPNVRVLSVYQLTPELADPIANTEMVLFLDSFSSSHGGDCRLVRLSEAVRTRPAGHDLSPEDLLRLARRLYGHSPEAWLIGIPAQKFDLGEKISPLARQGIGEAAELVRNMCRIKPFLTGAEGTSKTHA